MKLENEFNAIEKITTILNDFTHDEAERVMQYANNITWQRRREQEQKEYAERNALMQSEPEFRL